MDNSVKAYNNHQREGEKNPRQTSTAWKEKTQATDTVFHDLQKNHSWEKNHLTPKTDRIKMQ